MPQVINTNIASLNAQRNLNASQGDANQALERLSSGLRINSAKDDAAGLAISTRFESQITGLNMAQRNANDGISLAQTAEGALDEVTSNLQRIRELAVQSANATNSTSDRQALNQEVQQRIAEINRVAAQTSFNGLKVLDGTFGEQTFQVGANSGETIGVSGLDSRGSQIGSIISATEGLSDTIVTEGAPAQTVIDVSDTGFSFDGTDSIDGTIEINGVSLTISDTSNDVTELATAIDDAIDTFVADTNNDPEDIATLSTVSVSGNAANGTLTFENDSPEDLRAVFNLATAPANATLASAAINDGASTSIDVSALDFTRGGVIDIGGTDTVIRPDSDFDSIASQLEDALQDAGNNLTVSNSAGVLTIANDSGGPITPAAITITDAPQGELSGTFTLVARDDVNLTEYLKDSPTDFEIEINNETFTVEGATSLNDMISQINAKTVETGVKANLNSENDEIIFSSQFGEAFQINLSTPDLLDAASSPIVDTQINATVDQNTVTVNDLNIATRDGAEEALVAIDYAFDKINGFRAELGAVQNRFESTIANLATTSENLSASNSRIRDADFAAETAELARTQVLQSAGLSVLAQANARPQQVLQLLQG
ncbi:flagellin [Marinobacter lacisalsi]|uniref:Flagellin n=1 Tax=Marinobacter lacisalsi TaxID=475979 RepID=A0ABV8QJ62_9GAMM